MAMNSRFHPVSLVVVCALVAQLGIATGCQSHSDPPDEEADAPLGSQNTGGSPESCAPTDLRVRVDGIDGIVESCETIAFELSRQGTTLAFSCEAVEEQVCLCILDEPPSDLGDDDELVFLSSGLRLRTLQPDWDSLQECPGRFTQLAYSSSELYGSEDDCPSPPQPTTLVVTVPGGVNADSCGYSMVAVREDQSVTMNCYAWRGDCTCGVQNTDERDILRFDLLQDGDVVDTWAPPFDFEAADQDCPAPSRAIWKNNGMGGMGGFGGQPEE